MAIKGDVVYVGGGFSSFEGGGNSFLAGITKGGAVQDLNFHLGNAVNTMAFDGNTLYVGGHFNFNGSYSSGLAAFDLTSPIPARTRWEPHINGPVYALTVTGNSIAVGGYFTEVNNLPRMRFAALNEKGSLTPLDAKLNGYNVYALEGTANSLYIGGGFSQAKGSDRLNSAKFSLNGSLSDWHPGPRFEVHAIKQQSGRVYRGGLGFFEIVEDDCEIAPEP
jgi:hypothetical protein